MKSAVSVELTQEESNYLHFFFTQKALAVSAEVDAMMSVVDSSGSSAGFFGEEVSAIDEALIAGWQAGQDLFVDLAEKFPSTAP